MSPPDSSWSGCGAGRGDPSVLVPALRSAVSLLQRADGTGRPGDRWGAPLPGGFLPASLLWILLLGAGPRGLPAQTPPDTLAPPDTAADTVPGDEPTPGVAPDTLSPDTLPVPEPEGTDTLPPLEGAPGDTASADSVAARVDTLPALPEGIPPGAAAGVWEWSREEIMAARAHTLAELLAEVPGLIALRGGDYGMPRTVAFPGAAGGGMRIFRDGVEHVPLSGSVPDLARIGLGGIDRVRVERSFGGLRVELRSHRPADPRPFSVVEAGTGDLDTNLLRGAFLHPSALGGNAGVALDRVDSQGRDFQQPGSSSSIWLRYTFVGGDRFGVAAELTRATQDRDTLFLPSRVTRTDWSVRVRGRLAEGLVADAFWALADLETDTSDVTDPAEAAFPFRSDARTQLGARIAVRRGPLFGRFAVRSFDGEGLPSSSLEAEAGARLSGWGGVAGTWRRDAWDPRAVTTVGVRAWTRDYRGLSAFGSWEEFERGVPFLPPVPADDGGNGTEGGAPDGGTAGDGSPPGPSFTTGAVGRLGLRFAWRGLDAWAAALTTEADSLHPLGLPMDRARASLAGGERIGWETSFRIPLLLLDGLDLVGAGQVWEPRAEPWPYFPRRTWNGAVSFHDTFLPSENLELWVDVGMEGRDPMLVPSPVPGTDGDAAPSPPVTVPAYRSWYARLQVRVVTVRVFVNLDNFMRRRVNQDFPGLLLPLNRTVFGVRWTLWN